MTPYERAEWLVASFVGYGNPPDLEGFRVWLEHHKDWQDKIATATEAIQAECNDLHSKLYKAISWGEFTDEQLDELGFEPKP